MAGRLYIVATPIGNLGDLTARSIETLRDVPIIACEHTRRSGTLLAHVGATPDRLVALHAHNEEAATAGLLDELLGGKDVALVSDAGTPLVSDPGFALVRAAWGHGIPVTPVPGCSAVLAALAASPIPVNRFRFEGFLPAKRAPRRDLLKRLLDADVAIVFFEAPHRMRNTLRDLGECGAGDRSLLICRELTKRFETLSFGTVDELLNDLVVYRGEFTCVLAPAAPDPDDDSVQADAVAVLEALCKELPPAQAARLAARITGRSRTELYDVAVTLAATP